MVRSFPDDHRCHHHNSARERPIDVAGPFSANRLLTGLADIRRNRRAARTLTAAKAQLTALSTEGTARSGRSSSNLNPSDFKRSYGFESRPGHSSVRPPAAPPMPLCAESVSLGDTFPADSLLEVVGNGRLELIEQLARSDTYQPRFAGQDEIPWF